MKEEKRELIKKTIETLDNMITKASLLLDELQQEFEEPDQIYVVDKDGNCVPESQVDDDDR